MRVDVAVFLQILTRAFRLAPVLIAHRFTDTPQPNLDPRLPTPLRAIGLRPRGVRLRPLADSMEDAPATSTAADPDSAALKSANKKSEETPLPPADPETKSPEP